MRWTQPIFAAALLATLAACSDDLPTAAVPRDPEAPRLSMDPTTARVVGYFPTWDGNVDSIQYSKLTHIMYAFALPTGSGGLGEGSTWLNEVDVDSYVESGSIAAGTWRKVSIPFSALGVTTNRITELVIQDHSGGAPPLVCFDDIRFVP